MSQFYFEFKMFIDYLIGDVSLNGVQEKNMSWRYLGDVSLCNGG